MATSLVKALTASDTVINVQNDLDFPDTGLVQIGSELIEYANRYKNTLYGCIRGVQSTVAAPHPAYAEVIIAAYYAPAPVDGVASIKADLETPLTSDVTLVSGTNVTLSQVGQEITIESNPPVTSDIPGTTTNDNAVAGNIGECIETIIDYYVFNPGATGDYYDVGSITLTPGDWDVRGLVQFNVNTSTLDYWAFMAGVGDSPGNTPSGLSYGYNYSMLSYPDNTISITDWLTLIVPTHRISIATTTTFYLKASVYRYTAGNPYTAGSITARRVR